ncbi:MAG: 30S ribosomal protein S13, partial [Prochlorococcaceae cyanobacterium]
MARIAGIDIPRDKRVEIALTYIYGIGLTTAQKLLAKTGVDPDTRVKNLSDGDVQKLRGAAEALTLEGDLRRQVGMALKRLQDIGCLRGRQPMS